jgi:hypothetical protein
LREHTVGENDLRSRLRERVSVTMLSLSPSPLPRHRIVNVPERVASSKILKES